MIRVTISGKLVEEALTTGYKIDRAIEVTDGIPAGSKLWEAEVRHGNLELSFFDSIESADRDIAVCVMTKDGQRS